MMRYNAVQGQQKSLVFHWEVMERPGSEGIGEAHFILALVSRIEHI
jgi:hypothetical protein